MTTIQTNLVNELQEAILDHARKSSKEEMLSRDSLEDFLLQKEELKEIFGTANCFWETNKLIPGILLDEGILTLPESLDMLENLIECTKHWLFTDTVY